VRTCPCAFRRAPDSHPSRVAAPRFLQAQHVSPRRPLAQPRPALRTASCAGLSMGERGMSTLRLSSEKISHSAPFYLAAAPATSGRVHGPKRLQSPEKRVLCNRVDHRISKTIVAHTGRTVRRCRNRHRLRLVGLGIVLHRVDKSLTHVTGSDSLCSDFAQSDDRILVVLTVHRNVRSTCQRASPVCCEEYQLEPVRHLVDAILDCHASHGTV